MFWWRRLKVAPLSIKFAVALAAFGGLVSLGAYALHAVLGDQGRYAVEGVVAQVGLAIYVMAATARLSRWPLVILLIVLLVTAVGSFGAGDARLVPVLILAFIGFAALVTPHWAKLNWRPFGLEPEDRPRPEDIFD